MENENDIRDAPERTDSEKDISKETGAWELSAKDLAIFLQGSIRQEFIKACKEVLDTTKSQKEYYESAIQRKDNEIKTTRDVMNQNYELYRGVLRDHNRFVEAHNIQLMNKDTVIAQKDILISKLQTEISTLRDQLQKSQ